MGSGRATLGALRVGRRVVSDTSPPADDPRPPPPALQLGRLQ